ncbi:hypothetical protein JTE90_021719 [Oedothorax gibbosus]|uniref:Uncharacterized protein n=1 Tax=Oedothorax gibbosus TaxID=931172 RepID=A0AAV6UH23_9ARAC|nr:hypothetical protein JTE90_021719 [Oedothorax gibbosus]
MEKGPKETINRNPSNQTLILDSPLPHLRFVKSITPTIPRTTFPCCVRCSTPLHSTAMLSLWYLTYIIKG